MTNSNTQAFGKNLFKSALIYSIGGFGSKVLSFLLLFFYTFLLTKKELGEYDIFITTITLFVPLVSFQIGDATYRWLIDKDKQDERLKAQIITNTIIAFCVGFLLFAIALFIYSMFEVVKYKAYFLILIFLNCLLPILQNILRGDGDTKKFALNGLITTFLLVVFNVLFLYVWKLKIEGILLANILAYTISCLFIIYQVKLLRYFSIRNLNKTLLKEMCRYSLPLIPNLMSWWVIGSASKFIILNSLGAEANGIYAISSRFPSIIVIVNTIFVLPIQDAFFTQGAELEGFRKLIKDFIKLEFSLIAILIVGAPIYTKYLVSEKFYEAWQYMPFLYLGVGFNTLAALISLVHQKNKKTANITVTTMLGGLLSIILSYFLIKIYGLNGISFAYFVGFFVIYLLRYFDLRKELSLRPNTWTYLLCLITLVFVIYIMDAVSFKLQLFLFALVVLFIIWINRNFIAKILKR
jgi:O-antigen/teichoic acid export membrane protein